MKRCRNPFLYSQELPFNCISLNRSVVFEAAVRVLFGEDLMRCPPGGAKQLESTFFRFEEAFELAASPLPHALQARWMDTHES